MSSSHDMPYLELRRLYKSFGEVEVLRDLSLDLGEGEILALLGPSGSGKTTALRILAGFEAPDQGSIVVAGEEVTGLATATRGFGMVFQHYALFPHMTVNQNVAFGLETRGMERAAMASRVRAMLSLVDLETFGQRRVSEISGGQQQRVALARALAPEPRVLLLDEPLSNLDPTLRERTRRELREAVRQVGITTVLVTHEQEEAFHVGDRVAVLHRGRLEQIGRPEELYSLPESRFVATFVGRAATFSGRLTAFHDGGLAAAEIQAVEGASVSWRGRRAGPLVEDGPVDLVARPESLRLADSTTENSLPGQLIDRRFTGALTYAVVALALAGQTAEVEVLVDPETSIQVGDPVHVAARQGATPFHIFPASPSGDRA